MKTKAFSVCRYYTVTALLCFNVAFSLGIPDSYIMQAGGWKSDNTLKSVYRHAMDSKKEEMQEFAAQYITELTKE